MFENLTDRLSNTLKSLRGQGRLSEQNIQDSLREVRQALLEADELKTRGEILATLAEMETAATDPSGGKLQ